MNRRRQLRARCLRGQAVAFELAYLAALGVAVASPSRTTYMLCALFMCAVAVLIFKYWSKIYE